MDKMVAIEQQYDGFFKNKRILITGHTGFKGSWLCFLLSKLGAQVYGYALEPSEAPNLYTEAGIDKLVKSFFGDIRDLPELQNVVNETQPEIVIHMAAQALVRESYKSPCETFNVNVMGTANILEAVRGSKSVKAVINVTTDKCYENQEWYWGYRENERLGGVDPYSSSKACSELVTEAFRNSFFSKTEFSSHGVAIASARAGNVIGGGDWSKDRLIPDFFQAISRNEKFRIRSPYAIRPWQHVLEPLSGYLTLALKLFNEGPEYAEAWNFGPEEADAKNVEWVTKSLCRLWGNGASYEIDLNPHPHEANYLKLDCSKAKLELGWKPKWSIDRSLELIMMWQKEYFSKGNILEVMSLQIQEYYEG